MRALAGWAAVVLVSLSRAERSDNFRDLGRGSVLASLGTPAVRQPRQHEEVIAKMRPEDFDWVVRQLKLNPGQAKRLERAAANQNVQLEIRLLPGHSLRPTEPTGGGSRPPFVDQLLGDLDPDLRANLSEIEPRLLAWVDASEENATLFATDPLAALRQAVPDLDQRRLAALERLRRRHSRPQPGGGVTLKNVRIVRGRGA